MNQVGDLVEANVRRNVIPAYSAPPAAAVAAPAPAANTPTPPPSACGTGPRAMSSISPPCAFEAYHWPITDEIDTAGTVATATGGAALSIEAAKVRTTATTESTKEGASNSSLPQPSLGGPTPVPPPPPHCSVGFETVLCADCLYESASLAPLERALRYVDA